MNSAKTKKIVILIAIGVAVFILQRMFFTPAAPTQEFAEPVVEEVEYVQVLMANSTIPTGTRLSSDYLIWQPWPAETVRPSLITNAEGDRPDAISELEGAIVSAQIFEGEPINMAKIVMAGESGVLAAMLSPGMRAVTTRISVETAAGGFIQPGDRVDVIVTRQFELRDDTDQDGGNAGGLVRDEVYIAETLFENVKVLAVDQTYATDPEGEAYVIGSTATFELNPEDSLLLQEAQSSGEISLTLRGLNAAQARARSAAKTNSNAYEEVDLPSDLVVYRSGEPQRVAIREQ